MIEIDGVYFSGKSSLPQRARVIYLGKNKLKIDSPYGEIEVSLDKCDISSRLGNTPRVLRFADGSAFETQDNDAIDSILREGDVGVFGRFVHALESRWRFVLTSVVLTIALVWFGIEYGIPAAANHVAKILPASTSVALGEGGLEAMDEFIFELTALHPTIRQRLRGRFDQLVEPLKSPFDYRLEFRKSPVIGPNAFALPSGIIVMTDELVNLASHDDEIVSVLAHEIGHVEHRHSMRTLLQNSAVALVVASVTGDIFSISALSAALPTILIETKFSRQFETESDKFALNLMRQHGIDLNRFADLMEKLHNEFGPESEALGFLSTHPLTKDRIAMFRTAAAN